MPDSLASAIALDALAVKMLCTTFVVVAVSWSVGALGPVIGGALSGLPIILGPGFYFLIQQSPLLFVSHAATSALTALCATQLFLLTYMATARWGRPLVSIVCAIGVWLLVAVICSSLSVPPMTGTLLYLGLTLVCLRVGRQWLLPTRAAAGRAGLSALLARGVIAGCVVAAVTAASRWLGSAASGVLLAFPIGYTVISTTVHQKMGNAAVIATLYSSLLGTLSLACFCCVLSVMLPVWPAHLALVSALVAAVGATVCLIAVRSAWIRRKRRVS